MNEQPNPNENPTMTIKHFLDSREDVRKLCEILDPHTIGQHRNWRGLAHELKGSTIEIEQYECLQRYYGTGSEPGLQLLKEITHRLPHTKFVEITEAAKKLRRGDIEEYCEEEYKNLENGGQCLVKDLPLSVLSKLGNFMEPPSNSISRNWKDFADYFRFTSIEINNIECKQSGNDIGSPTEALLKLVAEQNSKLQLKKILGILKSMRRIDAAECIETFINQTQENSQQSLSDQTNQSIQLHPNNVDSLVQNHNSLHTNQRRPPLYQGPVYHNRQPPCIQNRQPSNFENEKPSNEQHQNLSRNEHTLIQEGSSVSNPNKGENNSTRQKQQQRMAELSVKYSLMKSTESGYASLYQQSVAEAATPQQDKSDCGTETNIAVLCQGHDDEEMNIQEDVNNRNDGEENLGHHRNHDPNENDEEGNPVGNLNDDQNDPCSLDVSNPLSQENGHPCEDNFGGNISEDEIHADINTAQENYHCDHGNSNVDADKKNENNNHSKDPLNVQLFEGDVSPNVHKSQNGITDKTNNHTCRISGIENIGHQTFHVPVRDLYNSGVVQHKKTEDMSASPQTPGATVELCINKTDYSIASVHTKDKEYDTGPQNNACGKQDHKNPETASSLDLPPLPPEQLGLQPEGGEQHNTTPHGLCFVFDNYEYKPSIFKKYFQSGAMENLKENITVDEHTISNYLSTLHCEVFHLENRNASEFTDMLESIGDVNQYNIVVVFILARGERDTFIGVDNQRISLRQFAKKLQQHFPSSIPKIVFAQLYQSTTKFQDPLEYEDTMVVVSATKENISYRRDKGSYFIQGLIESLQKYKHLNLQQIVQKILAQVLQTEDKSPEEIRNVLKRLGKKRWEKFSYADMPWEELMRHSKDDE